MRNSSRAKIHLFNDLPHLYELEEMMAFCTKYEHLYICGAEENQEYLLKFFDNCGINIDGYAVTCPEGLALSHYRKVPILAIDEVIQKPDTGVILALPDRYYRYFIPKFRKAGYSSYFVMTEYNKRTIAEQLKPRPIEEMTFEINLADHCNLSCQMCDHYSQLSEENFVNMETFEKDLLQMGKLYNHRAGAITLLGGEPLLHKEIIKCLKIVRREFPEAELIILTNGLLLLKWENSPNGNLWQACKELDVHITVTLYPVKFDYAPLKNKAEEYGIPLAMSSNIHADELTKVVKISDKHVFNLSCDAPKYGFISCLYFNKFNVLREGRYYACPVSACIGIFNKKFNQNLQLTEKDSVDIYSTESWEDFAAFSAGRVPFCGYCDVLNWRRHSEWKASSKKIEEYV